MMLEKLPRGWATASMPDVITRDGIFSDGDWVESKDQDPNGDVRLVQLADIGDGFFRDRSRRFLTSEKAAQLRCTFLEEGDVLIARMPDPLGRACIFPGDRRPSVTAVDVCIVRSGTSGIYHRWLMNTVNSLDFRAEVARLQSGTTRKRISHRNLATIEFPVPPLAEQHRIVEAIETHFSQLDAGVAALKRLQAKLERYRAAVLKAACEGTLLPPEEVQAIRQSPDYEPADQLLKRILAERRQRWEEEQIAKGKNPAKLKYKEPQPPDTEGLPELPAGWVRATVSQISTTIQYGTSDRANIDASGVPVLRMANIQDGQLDFKSLKYLPVDYSKLSDFLLQEGDVIFNRTNSAELVGKTAVYKRCHPKAIFASYLIRVKVLDGCLPDYLAIFINSFHGRRYIASVVSQQVGQANVNGTKLSKMTVALPPLAEQLLIVGEVERQLSVISSLTATVTAGLVRSERLRQSILKEAFAGRLVPQDPNDEPASVLLNRIRTRREESRARSGSASGHRSKKLGRDTSSQARLHEV